MNQYLFASCWFDAIAERKSEAFNIGKTAIVLFLFGSRRQNPFDGKKCRWHRGHTAFGVSFSTLRWVMSSPHFAAD